MFQEMRKKDREMSRPEAEDILVQGLYGVLSMNAGDDYAYGVPLSYVYQDNKIYLHCALEGKKLTHLRRQNKVSFCVVLEAEPLPDKFSMKYQSAMAFGKIHEVDRHRGKIDRVDCPGGKILPRRPGAYRPGQRKGRQFPR